MTTNKPIADDPLAQAVAKVRAEFDQLTQAAIIAAQGHEEVTALLDPVLTDMTQTETWRPLSLALRRIIVGERDPAELLAGLDLAERVIVGDVLRGLGVDYPDPYA